MQFQWRKFSRLIKYYKCWQACALIKNTYHSKAWLILRQYRAFKFKRSINNHIKEKKALILQRFLRKVLLRNRLEHYQRNLGKIITIQSYFRMFRARRRFKARMLIKI